MRFLRAAFLVLVLAAAFAVASTAGAVGNGSVSVVSASSNVPQGGTVDIQVVIDPPSFGTSIWIIQIPYDPTVVQVATDMSGNPVCTPLSAPANFVGATGCAVRDTNGDNVPDTLVAFGGVIMNNNGTPVGLTSPQTVATFTFRAIGPPGSASSLHVIVTAMLGPNGEQETPTTFDGVINVVAGAAGRTPALNLRAVCIDIPNNSDIVRHPEKYPNWTVGGCSTLGNGQ